jgi:hypothetical protein
MAEPHTGTLREIEDEGLRAEALRARRRAVFGATLRLRGWPLAKAVRQTS